MWRWLLLALAIAQPACESCELSYGSYLVQGTVAPTTSSFAIEVTARPETHTVDATLYCG